TDIYMESVTGLPQIVVKYHREAIAMYQLNISDVNQVLRSAFAGEVAGTMYENERRFDLVIRMQEGSRKDITDIGDLLINTPTGLQVPLSQLAEISVKDGPNQIQREDARRRIITAFNVRGRDVQSVVEELQEKLNAQFKLPAGYSIEYGGQFENLSKAKARLSIAVPAALLLILTMLYFAFGSMKYGILIFTAIPLSAIGGVFALTIRGMPFSISAGIGFIALFGVAVLNGIVLITEFNRLKKEGGLNSIKEIIMEGTKLRLRPVLMTAAVASLGFLPMALSTGSGAEVQRPLATVVIGGLLTATVLTLIVLPVLYSWIESRSKKSKRADDNAAGSTTLPLLVLLMIIIPSFIPGLKSNAKAQTIDELISLAKQNNIGIGAAKKHVVSAQQMEKASVVLPKTTLGGEYGKINSAYSDNRFFVSQNFGLPMVYQRQKELYKAETQLRQQQVALKENELVQQVRTNFYSMVILLEKQKLLKELDSVYRSFSKSAAIRFQTGETNVLETTTAESLVEQLVLQSDELQQDLQVYQARLKNLLNSTEDFYPRYDTLKIQQVLIESDTAGVASNPLLTLYEQQIRIAGAQKQVERNAMSPDFTLGYNNMSIRGYQSKDGVNQQYYGGGDRFSFYQLTLGLPIFNGAAKAKIRAMQSKEDAARLELAAGTLQLKTSLSAIQKEQQKINLRLRYFERTGLKQADLMIRNAMLSFKNGDIGYVEWTVIMNNAVNIRTGYLDAIQAYNLSAIETLYLTAQ
ncbi:MAG: CusA/CzcA family heavy metal efflux RND transporter, partial [Chitinophagaceae bacterium]